MHNSQPVTVSGAQFDAPPFDGPHGRPLTIALHTVEGDSRLERAIIADLTHADNLTVLLHIREDAVYIPPNPAHVLVPGDRIVVLASQTKLQELGARDW